MTDSSGGETPRSHLYDRLEPVGRILELPGWYVWGASPIDGPDGRVHLFAARWPAETGMRGWITHSEVVHCVGPSAEGPFEAREVVLQGRGPGYWDANAPHNPTIHRVGDAFYLFHIANTNGSKETQRIGVARADSLDGPWERFDSPVLGPRPGDGWDSWYVTNPGFLHHPSGQCWLYYKTWDRADDMKKFGLATADRPEGPYRFHQPGPVIDFSPVGKQLEDPYVFVEDGRFYLAAADDNEGILRKHAGLLFDSADGVVWNPPKLLYDTNDVYLAEPRARFERPQLLVRDGRATHLYVACGGGRQNTTSPVCFRLRR